MNNNELINDDISTQNEFPFVEDEAQKIEKPTRLELEKLSNSKLAKMAEPMQKRYSFSSLKGRSKNYLIDIILGVKDESEIGINGNSISNGAKAPQAKSESEELINYGLTLLNAIKQHREGQNAELNPIAKEMFKNSAIVEVDKARADGTIKTDKFNSLMLGLSGAFLVVDGVVGIKNIPTLFKKLKDKVNSKPKQ